MPLDDHEQRILAEIERQFYEEDPALAHAVRNIDRPGRFGVRVPLLGLVSGIVVIIATFTVNTVVALAGFGLMVASTTALVYGIRGQGGLLSKGRRSGGAEGFRRFGRFRRS